MQLAALLLPVVILGEVASGPADRPADRMDARNLGAALRRQLEAEGVRVVPAASAQGEPTGAGRASADEDRIEPLVSGAIAEARRLSAEFAEGRALGILDRAEAAYRRSPRPDPRLLVDLLLARARIQFDLGRVPEARQTLRRAAVLAPDRRLAAGEFDPGLLGLWGSERRASQRAEGVLVVEGQGEVIVDGIPRGPATQTVHVPAGEHHVCLRLDGRFGPVELTTLAAGASRSLHPSAPRPSEPEGGQLSAARRAAAQAAGASGLVEAVLHRSGGAALLEARLIDAASGRVLATAGGTPETVAASLALALRSGGPPAGPGGAQAAAEADPSRKPDEGRAQRPLYGRWWFWTAVGAALVGGTTAVFLGTSQDRVDLVLHR